jgi:FkbM family methyltransferase
VIGYSRLLSVLPPAVSDELRTARRVAWECAGSDRYSRPSLHGIEGKLHQLFDGKAGFFVEVGSFDGFAQSNTYWLERFRGWRGVLIEAVPAYAKKCQRRRRQSTVVNCALVAPGDAGTAVNIRSAGLMSFIPGARGTSADDDAYVKKALRVQRLTHAGHDVVPGRTLTDVLATSGAPRRLDLLSLDVEGYEGLVLLGLDVARFRPRFILVEDFEAGSLDEQLDAMGYDVADARFTPQDRLYRDREGG